MLYAESMFTPGAKWSSLVPKFDQGARISWIFVAPMVRTSRSEAGENFMAFS